MLSTITVLPNKLYTICSYFLSYLTKSDAIPTTPFIPFVTTLSIFLPLTEVTGKNDALPKLLSLKCLTSFFASSSV